MGVVGVASRWAWSGWLAGVHGVGVWQGAEYSNLCHGTLVLGDFFSQIFKAVRILKGGRMETKNENVGEGSATMWGEHRPGDNTKGTEKYEEGSQKICTCQEIKIWKGDYQGINTVKIWDGGRGSLPFCVPPSPRISNGIALNYNKRRVK